MTSHIQNQVTITWSNLTAVVGEKILVDDCSGYAKPGQMLAIMGPSGAGKTTLLSLLAARNAKNVKMTGQVKANGVQYNSKEFYDFSNFVYQNDILFESMTVRQCVQFSAKLRIKGDEDYIQKKVNQIIQDLQLTKCQNTKIGGGMIKGVSGGQRKRTCIAMQAITSPSVLVLDEPTSGLDSFTSGILLDILLKMAQSGKTIILTIHQPSSILYSKLDRLILLHKGKTIYQGKANNINKYLNELQIIPPDNYNISDFFMLQISEFNSKRNKKQSSFNFVQYGYKLQPQIQKTIINLENQSHQIGFTQKQIAYTIRQQMFIIMRRAFKQIIRNPMKMRNQILDLIVSIVIIGCIFYMTAKNPPAQYSFQLQFFNYLMNVQGACFMGSVSAGMSGIYANLLVFSVERQIFVKQSSSRYYHPLAYYISRTLIQFPIGVIIPLMFASCLYFMLGLSNTSYQFFIYAITVIVTGLTGRALGIMMGAIFKDAAAATSVGNFLLIPLLMFSGVLSPLDSVSPVVSWMQYISPFKYCFQAVVYNQFNGVTFKALNMFGQIIIFDPLKQLKIDTTSGQSIGCLIAVAFGFYILGYIFLRTFSSKLSA